LRKGSSCKESSYSNSYPKKEYKKEREDRFLKDKSKETPKDIGKDVSTPQTRSTDIQWFKCLGRGHTASQCPNRRTMILRGRDEYRSKDDEFSREEKENSEGAYPCEGELKMIRRTLNNQPSIMKYKERTSFTQDVKFLKTISLIVDSGSCCNCCSTRMVEMLDLKVIPHPKPYKLQWINEDGELTVDKQVKVKIFVGNYKDEILCDV